MSEAEALAVILISIYSVVVIVYYACFGIGNYIDEVDTISELLFVILPFGYWILLIVRKFKELKEIK